MDNVDNWLDKFRGLNPGTIPTETKKTKDFALPIATVLSALDKGDKNFYDNLSEDEKKSMSLWLLMRWMSSTKSLKEHHLMMVNDIVNYNFSDLSKHPELQWKLLSMCGSGKNQYHEWISPPKGMKKNRMEELIFKFYPMMNDNEIELMLKINTENELETFLKDNGYDDKLIKDVFKKK
jgi:hypothetical protein